jgi:O-antigen/teichoic acid export membrane protein
VPQFLIDRLLPLVRSPFVRNAGGMMALTLLGQGVYLITAPMLGRLYSPEQMGVYGLFFTIAVTSAGFVCLLYDFAIPAASTEEEARDLTFGSALIALPACLLIGAILSVLSALGLFGLGQLPFWAGALMAVILLAQVGVQLAQSWRIRWQETITIGKAGITLNVVRGATQVLVGLLAPLWWVLGLGELIGRAASLVHLMKRRWHQRLLRKRPLSSIRRTLARYREFPIVLMPAQAIEAVAIVAQIAGLNALFGAAGLGQYFLMRRTLDLPAAFVFRALSDVFYARLSEDSRTRPEAVRPFFAKAFLLLAVAGIVVGIPVILWGPELFVFIYGPGWSSAGSLAAVMVPAVVLNLAVAPVSRIFALTTKPHLRFAFGIVNTVGTLLALAAADRFSLDLLETTACLSAVISGSYLVYFAAGYAASGHIRISGAPIDAAGRGTVADQLD